MIDDANIGVKGLITYDEKILGLVKANGLLDLPGGRKKNSESIKKCLQREITEETSLIVRVQEPVAAWFIEKPSQLITGITYVCQYLDGEVVLSDEHRDFIWIDIKEINRLNFFPSYGLNQLSIRKNTGWQVDARLWSLPQIN